MDTAKGTKKGKTPKNRHFIITGEFKLKCNSLLHRHKIPLEIYNDPKLDEGISGDTIKNLVYPKKYIEKEKKKPTFYRHDYKSLEKFLKAIRYYKKHNKKSLENFKGLEEDYAEIEKDLAHLSRNQENYFMMFELQEHVDYFDVIYDIEIFMLDYFFDTYAMIDKAAWVFCNRVWFIRDKQKIITEMWGILNKQESPADISSMKEITAFMRMALKNETEFKELYKEECFKSKTPIRNIDWTKEMPKAERRKRNKSINEKIKDFDKKNSLSFKKIICMGSIHLRHDFWKMMLLYKMICLSDESKSQLEHYLDALE